MCIVLCIILSCFFVTFSSGQAVKINDVGRAPDIVVDHNGDVHAIYMVSHIYKYRKIGRDGTIGPEIDVGFGLERDDSTRSYGEIVVDSKNQPHIFSGPGYATLPTDATEMQKITLGKRDNSITIDSKDKILIIYRGTEAGEYSGPGMIQGQIKESGDSDFGQVMNLDENYQGRNRNVYCAAMAGPDDKFHVILRHGPDNSIYYLESADGTTWGEGEQISGVNLGEAPRIVVTPKNRILMCDMDGLVKEKMGPGNWVSRGHPVEGEDRKPSSLATDKLGNVYISSIGGQVAVLKDGENTWSTKIVLEHAGTEAFTYVATGADGCTYVIYEGENDEIYVVRVGMDGKIAKFDSPVNMIRDLTSDAIPNRNKWTIGITPVQNEIVLFGPNGLNGSSIYKLNGKLRSR
ncbi:MAG: hypothetical protein HQK83_16185 [Fibrobacteria bacterium]|nr:hypothetical protein [Fibrobacteria bacterium]